MIKKGGFMEDKESLKKQVNAYFSMIRAIADTIKDLKRIPSGHLYAQLMSHIDLSTYEKIIDILKRTKLIEEKHNELIWIGPSNQLNNKKDENI